VCVCFTHIRLDIEEAFKVIHNDVHVCAIVLRSYLFEIASPIVPYISFMQLIRAIGALRVCVCVVLCAHV